MDFNANRSEAIIRNSHKVKYLVRTKLKQNDHQKVPH